MSKYMIIEQYTDCRRTIFRGCLSAYDIQHNIGAKRMRFRRRSTREIYIQNLFDGVLMAGFNRCWSSPLKPLYAF